MFRAKARKLPYYFNQEDLVRLTDSIEEPKMLVAFSLGLLCGLRISEICNLKFSDIDFMNQTLTVRNGKMIFKNITGQGKDRVVPIPNKIIPALRMWQSININEEYLLPSITVEGHIHSGSLMRMFAEALEKVQLRIPDKVNVKGRMRHKFTFHTLRHTYATMLWERTGDIYAVKAALGHSSIDMTMIYTHVSNKALKDKVNSAFDFGAGFKNLNQEFAPRNLSQQPKEDLSPLDYLQLRLGRGEIDLPTYRTIVAELGQKINETNYLG